MAKVPRFAEASAGRWPIVEMDNRTATSSSISVLQQPARGSSRPSGKASCSALQSIQRRHSAIASSLVCRLPGLANSLVRFQGWALGGGAARWTGSQRSIVSHAS
jgi:hypothetical protein